jgi:hypothetical protein
VFLYILVEISTTVDIGQHVQQKNSLVEILSSLCKEPFPISGMPRYKSKGEELYNQLICFMAMPLNTSDTEYHPVSDLESNFHTNTVSPAIHRQLITLGTNLERS